jgi:hypothetical protein
MISWKSMLAIKEFMSSWLAIWTISYKIEVGTPFLDGRMRMGVMSRYCPLLTILLTHYSNGYRESNENSYGRGISNEKSVPWNQLRFNSGQRIGRTNTHATCSNFSSSSVFPFIYLCFILVGRATSWYWLMRISDIAFLSASARTVPYAPTRRFMTGW